MFCTTGVSTSSSVWIIILACPVEMRIIKMQFYALFLTFFCQFFHYIALEWSGIYNIIIRIFCIKHGKSVMMSGCKTDIFGTGLLYGGNPFLCIETYRIET